MRWRFPGATPAAPSVPSAPSSAPTGDTVLNHSAFTTDPHTLQVTLIKQEKVACLTDNDAHRALESGDAFQVRPPSMHVHSGGRRSGP